MDRQTREKLREMPEEVKDEIGYALDLSQQGGKLHRAKPLKGFAGASVLEIRDDYDTDTYRCIYTVQYAEAVYYVHAFRKKSRRGIETPQNEMETVKRNLKIAEEAHKARLGE